MSAPYHQLNEFFLIGKTLKSHGTAGQIRLMVEDRLHSYLKQGSFIFLELDGSRVPFQIASFDDHRHVVISLADVHGKQESDLLTGKEIWVPVEQVQPRHLKSPKNLKEKWEDYTIHDEKTGKTFPILRTEEYPQQLMAVIEIEERELLIPLHEKLINDIDKDKQIIHMEIPEGLLEL